jgi:hypothetical protein
MAVNTKLQLTGQYFSFVEYQQKRLHLIYLQIPH